MSKQKQSFLETATGTIKIHPRGFGFILPEERKHFPEDIFIPRHATKGAVDGDFVEASVQKSPKGFEGKITKILKRGRLHVAGTIVLKNKKNFYAYVPLLGDDRWMLINPADEKDLNEGDRIIIRVIDWGSQRREAIGEMSAYIGHINDPSCDIPAAIEEFELEDAFSKKALDEASQFGKKISNKDFEGREDLRDLICVTIDPDTAKDFDDALSLTQDKNGNFHLGVHIADVSHYVRLGSQLDKEAKERCNSVYFPGSVLPMLPHSLSSHLCSLMPNVNRLAVSILATFDKEGNLLNFRYTKSVIKSKKRFTYKEAKQVLDGLKKSQFSNLLFLMVDLCHRLKTQRALRGSIEFALPDVFIHVDANGNPKKIETIQYDITHQLVEEFMLKANELVASHLLEQGKPLAYRIHEEPNPENMKEFAATARILGFALSDEPTSEELQTLFDQARGSAVGQFLTTLFIRNMKLASYSIQNVGHFGLCLQAYTHFTSPIRRYIDLTVHRALCDIESREDDLEFIATRCSEKERLASKAENAVILLKKLRLLQKVHKQEPHRNYEATVTAVKAFGFAFEIEEFMFEGFLPLSAIEKNGRFYFDEKRKRLKLQNRHFHSGDKIYVSLKSINLITLQTEWYLTTVKKGKAK